MRYSLILLALFLSASLFGYGQKGDLYVPESKPVETKPAELKPEAAAKK